jgi:lysozyme family protein
MTGCIGAATHMRRRCLSGMNYGNFCKGCGRNLAWFFRFLFCVGPVMPRNQDAYYSLLLRVLVLLLLAAPTITSPAAMAQGKRVALVIGNGQYLTVGPLANPSNDAARTAEALKRLHFDDVRVSIDASYTDLRRAIAEFSQLAQGADVALVFYAGHGIEVTGENYLIPVDAKLARAKDVEFETISLRQVQSTVEDSSGIGIVILDACRNNPFINRMINPGGRRAISPGLSRPATQGNTLIVYSARDGTTASDGSGANSPFTTALLKSIETPGVEIGLLFRQVRDDVIAATGPDEPQEPFTYGSLSAKPIYLAPPKAGELAAGEAPLDGSKASRPLALEPSLDEYRTQFRTATLKPEWDEKITLVRDRLAANRPRYEVVAKATGVPWFVIGILHLMESDGNFDRHLHNGDPLSSRTVSVPKNRPVKGEPPFTWEDSAIDLFGLSRFSRIKVWTVEDTLSAFERYNGLGLRKRGVPTPYLWSGSNLYVSGNYSFRGKDVVFDPQGVSKLTGAAVMLKYAVPLQEVERLLNYR